MPQLINLFLVIFGVIAMGAGLASEHQHPAAWLVVLLGLGLVGLAYVSDRRRERCMEERKRVAVQRRLDQLTSRRWGASDSLRIPGSIWLTIASVLLLAVGAGALYAGIVDVNHDWQYFAIGAGFLAIGIVALPRAMAGFGQPVLELTATGLATPVNGRIAWRDVSGIYLQAITQRGGRQSWRLLFRVAHFARVAGAVHWTDRLMASFRLGPLARGVLNVGLPSSKEDPQAVYALARLLWKQATGNDYGWNPLASDTCNEALRRTGAHVARLNEPGAMKALLAHPQRALDEMEQASRDMALIAAEARRQSAKARWFTAVGVLLALLLAAWPLVRRMLHLYG